MQAKELRSKTREELQRMVTEHQAMLRDFRFKTATRQLSKVHEVKRAKRDLARIQTVLTTLAA